MQNLDAGSQLCTRCGLCCMGVLHGAAVLDVDETAHARDRGLTILESTRPLFALPCPKLQGSVCGIYDDRPRVCGRYKCQLLQDLEAASVPMAVAMTRVIEAKRLVEDTRAKPSNPLESTLSRTALNLYLDKFFRNSRDRKSLEVTAMELEKDEAE